MTSTSTRTRARTPWRTPHGLYALREGIPWIEGLADSLKRALAELTRLRALDIEPDEPLVNDIREMCDLVDAYATSLNILTKHQGDALDALNTHPTGEQQ